MPPAKPIAPYTSDLADRLAMLRFDRAEFVRWAHRHHRVSVDEPTLSRMLGGTYKLDANLLPFVALFLQRDPRTADEAVDVVFGGMLSVLGCEPVAREVEPEGRTPTQAYLTLTASMGTLGGTLAAALADGEVTLAELRELRRAAIEHRAEADRLLAELDAQIANAGAPARRVAS